MKSTKLSVLAAAVMLAASFTSAHAKVFSASDGSATVDITSVANGGNTDVTIVLTNTTANSATTGAINLLTGVSFTPTDISTFSLDSQSAAQSFHFTSQTDGTINTGPFDPHWSLVTSPAHSLYFNGFGGGGMPIIGPAASSGVKYPNAGSSLTSGPHGDYAYETATFHLSVAGAFSADSLTGATFYFNTNGDKQVGCLDCGGATPEPASLGVLGLGALGFLARRRKA